jgi:Family of unknown function (DUF5670)
MQAARTLCIQIAARHNEENAAMLETIAILLLMLWALGLLSSYSMGGLIHILLVIAVIVMLVRVIQGKRL